MTPADLTPWLAFEAVVAWTSAAILVLLSRRLPRSSALGERAWVAVILAAYLTAYALLATSIDSGNTAVSETVARFLIRFSAVVLGLVPPMWLLLYARKFR